MSTENYGFNIPELERGGNANDVSLLRDYITNTLEEIYGTLGGQPWIGGADRNGNMFNADGSSLEVVLQTGDELHGHINGLFQDD